MYVGSSHPGASGTMNLLVEYRKPLQYETNLRKITDRDHSKRGLSESRSSGMTNIFSIRHEEEVS